MDLSSLSLSSLQRPDPTQMRQQLFKKTDADSSGSITKQELTDTIASMPKPPGGGETPDVDAMFTKMDTDANGEVSESEHTDFLKQAETERGGQRPPPPSGGFDGRTDTLNSLLSVLQESSDAGTSTSTDMTALIEKLVASLKERATSYNADGTTTSSAKSLFETDV